MKENKDEGKNFLEEEESWLDETWKTYEKILPDDEDDEKKNKKKNFISRKIEEIKMERQAKAIRKEKALWDYIEKSSNTTENFLEILKKINEDDEDE